MEFNHFTASSNFVDLLSSQQNVVFGNVSDSVSLSESQVPFFGSQGTQDSNFGEETQASRKERRTWSPTDDVVLISSWLNTSKDAVVGNEHRSLAFWKRIAAYYNVSPKLSGCERREASHCKNRWQKINDVVCKFCGAYEAASRKKSSGQNDNDVLKLAHEIFFTNHKKKNHPRACLERVINNSSPGVKVAKAASKKKMVDGKELVEFQSMWSIKKQDLAVKERLCKMKLLDSFIAKQRPLEDYEEALKKKLINELMGN
ncbi:hypothetical protein N665_0579s0007 [Sinapis alba]|nr:hypothetical protein N665_0579s0007 [Sinapis alba]